ncbi:MAG: hypothetical protein ACI9GE_000787, partial [Oceanospirillaceae bacterium]
TPAYCCYPELTSVCHVERMFLCHVEPSRDILDPSATLGMTLALGDISRLRMTLTLGGHLI